MSNHADIVRIIPVYVVIPPRVLLLDVAGPLEVLRKANLEQHKVRFEVHYIGPAPTALSSIGLPVAGWNLCRRRCHTTHSSLFRVRLTFRSEMWSSTEPRMPFWKRKSFYGFAGRYVPV